MLERLRSAFASATTPQAAAAELTGPAALDAARRQIEQAKLASAAPARPAANVEQLTAAELTRRVDSVLSRAIEQGDYATVSALALYSETSKIVTPPEGARLTFQDADTLGRVVVWLRRSYADILSDPVLRLHTAASTPALAQASFTRECADAADLSAAACVEVPRYHNTMTAGEQRMEVHFKGAGAAALMESINKFIKVRALDHRSKTGSTDAERPAIRAWFTDTLQRMPQAAAETQAIRAAAQHDKPQGLLPDELSKALFHRMVHLREMHDRAGGPELAAEAMRRESRHANRTRDCLTLAALALLAQEIQSIPLGGVAASGAAPAPEPQPRRQQSQSPAQPQAAQPAQPKYMTTEQVAELIHYDARTIRERLRKTVFREGVHYVKPGRKTLYIREAIEKWVEGAEGFC